MRRSASALGIAVVCALTCVLSACARERPGNPAFELTREFAKCEFEEMREDKVALERPVLILSGFGDPGVVVAGMAKRLRSVTTTPELMTSISFLFDPTIESARTSTIERALSKFADGDTERLAEMEFDLVCFSMGGLVGRLASFEGTDDLPALRVRRLFTISTPHLGARGAEMPSFDRKVHAMRSGSDFLARLDAALPGAEFELYCYVRTGDGIVGDHNAAPEGHPVLWLPNEAYEFAHLSAGTDVRFLADIARRLRGEPAYADLAGSPLPPAE